MKKVCATNDLLDSYELNGVPNDRGILLTRY